MLEKKKIRWQFFALTGISALSFFLNFWNLAKEGYSNQYYAAAVHSMLQNPAAFFFGSLDSGLYVTVDKPPLGLWLQTLSSKIFGVNAFGLILPSALAGCLCVLLVYFIVKKVWGPTWGVAAAGIAATTPILAAMSRTNDLDMLLVVFLLLGALVMLRAARKQSLPLYVLAMVFVALGFNVKMLEAFLVVPAFLFAYFMGNGKISKKLIHTAVAVCVLLAVSFSWVVAVDAIPAADRPYIGSSSKNSELDLVFGYNGITRLLGEQARQPAGLTGADGNVSAQSDGNFRIGDNGGARLNFGPGGSQESGQPGIFRLFNTQLSGLISWFLLPAIAMAGLAVYGFFRWIFRKREKIWPEDKKQKLAFILFWSAWLVPAAIFFSYGGFIHRYYVVLLFPAIAILAASAAAYAWRSPHKKWLVPVGFSAALALQCMIAGRTSWSWILIPMFVCGCAAIVFFLLKRKPFKTVAAILMAGALLIAPVAWSLTPAFGKLNATIPDAGPQTSSSFETNIVPSGQIPVLEKFIVSHYNGERWALAVSGATEAAPIMLDTGLPVMAVGGFSGSDSILTLDALKKYTASGELKYYLVTGFGRGGNEIGQWLQQNGKPVDIGAGISLYDLSQIK